MMNKNLIFSILLIVFSFKSFGQKQKEFKIFKGDGFEISYPEKWTAAKDGNVYNFYLNTNLGDISISVYKNSKLTSIDIKDAILSINENRKKEDTVKMVAKGVIKEYSYEYSDNGVKWLAKGIQNKKDFFFITLNWKINDWNNNNPAFMQSFNSFRVF